MVHWCKVLQAASQDEGVVAACPCGAVGTDGAKGDLVTRPVIASGQVGWKHGDGDGAVGQLNAEGSRTISDEGALGAVCGLLGKGAEPERG